MPALKAGESSPSATESALKVASVEPDLVEVVDPPVFVVGELDELELDELEPLEEIVLLYEVEFTPASA